MSRAKRDSRRVSQAGERRRRRMAAFSARFQGILGEELRPDTPWPICALLLASVPEIDERRLAAIEERLKLLRPKEGG